MDQFSIELDRFHELEKKWGTISLTPFIFAPTAYTPRDEAGKPGAVLKGSFAIEPAAHALDFGTFYSDYNSAEGQSLFSERTLTRNYFAAGLQSNAAEGLKFQTELDNFQRDRSLLNSVQDNQLSLFRQSAERAQQGAKVKDDAAVRLNDSAQARLSQARAAALSAGNEASAAKLATARAQAQSDSANSILDAAQHTTDQTDPALKDKRNAAIQAAQAESFKATLALNNAKAAEAAVDDRAKVAKDELTAAGGAAAAATTNLNSQLGSALTAGTKPDSVISGTSTFPTAPTSEIATTPLTEAKTAVDALKVDPSAIPKVDTPSLVPAATDKTGGGFNPMTRVTAAAGAALAKNVFTFLGNPEAAENFKDKKLLFAVSTLSVDPGYVTQKDFTANIEATPSFTYVNAHEETVRKLLQRADYPLAVRARIALQYPAALNAEQRKFFEKTKSKLGEKTDCDPYVAKLEDVDKRDAHTRPYSELTFAHTKDGVPEAAPVLTVAAVSPLVDVQNLDLASSYARQDEIALFLAATVTQAGYKGQGSAFSSWVRQRRKDVATRSSLAVANSYTLGGGVFGFEIGPRLKALADPAARKSDAAMTFERQSFPVLVLVGLTEDDAKPLLTWGESGKIKVWELKLTVRYTTSWSRTKRSFWNHFKPNQYPSDKLFSIEDLVDEQARFQDAIKPIWNSLDPQRPEDAVALKDIDILRKELAPQFDSIARKLFGSTFDCTLPAAWLVPNSGTDVLNPPPGDLTLKANDLQFRPAALDLANTGTEAAPQASALVLIGGPNLSAVDVAKIKIASGDATFDPQKVAFVGTDAIAIELVLKGEKGKVQFALPLKESAPGLAAMSTNTVLSQPLDYKIRIPHEPAILPWEAAARDYAIGGTENNGVWTGKLHLLVRGTNLDLLDLTPVLRGAGAVTGTVSLAVPGKEAAIYDVSLSGPVSGAAYLEFSALPAGSGKRVFSDSFTYKFFKTQ